MEKRAAVLTGHTRGLGAAIAEQLLQRGIAVLGLARTHNVELAARHPEALTQVALDLADTAALEDWLRQPALGRHLQGAAQVLLVNNAGLLQPVGALPLQPPAAIAAACAVNVTASLMLAAALAAAATQEQDRRILHMSSGAGRHAYAGWSIYCASKAALDHHARAVAQDQDVGLRICSLAPGVIDTGMQAEIRATSRERFPARERFIALKRDGQLLSPEQCARQVVDFLLSPVFGQEPVADLRN